jgi:hypothetical protein
MGRLRSCNFDAVIGIGGIGARATADGISNRVNWVGIGTRKAQVTGMRGPLVTFAHFKLFEEEGPDFRTIAPNLARRLYLPKAARFLFDDNFNKAERAEVRRVLSLARTAESSAEPPYSRQRHLRCRAKCC